MKHPIDRAIEVLEEAIVYNNRTTIGDDRRLKEQVECIEELRAFKEQLQGSEQL